MRIVYLNPCGKLGGAETSLRELLASVRAAAPTWELVLVLGEDGPLAGIARDLGVQVVLRPFPPPMARLGDSGGLAGIWSLMRAVASTLGYARGLTALLRQLKPEIVHSNGFKMHLLGAWTRPRGSRLIWHIHDYVGSRRVMSVLLRIFRKNCSLAIVNSKSVGRDLNQVLPGMPTAVIYNAIDLGRFSPSGKKLDLDALAGLPPPPEGTLRVGLVATFARWKGHKVFLEALGALNADVPVRGYILGGPIYQTAGSQWTKEELVKAADQCGLGNKLGFTGFLENLSDAMRSLDIVVHASTEPEPFGMVIVEAMASGKAVIASQAGGAAELFTDGENALGHPPGDARMLSRQILRLASDAALRHKLGEAGRSTAERLYPGQRLAKELLAVYARVAVGGRVSSRSELAAQPAHPETLQ